MAQNDDLKPNPWNRIPLEDYESHMSDISVGQSQLLNSLAEKYLDMVKPETCVFLGVTGGNGLEHINNSITKTVIGIDINQHYLDETNKRYGDRINRLQLLNYDITDGGTLCNADLVWAALIMEYTGVEKCLQFSNLTLAQGGRLVLTIQANNNAPGR